MEEFGFGKEVATLTVSLFVAGFCLGPLVWGPLCEDVSCFELFCHSFLIRLQIGRRPVYLITFLVDVVRIYHALTHFTPDCRLYRLRAFKSVVPCHKTPPPF